MAVISGIRTGLKTILEASATPLRTYDTMPEQLEPPCAVVWPDDPFVDYLGAFGNGLNTYRWVVQMYTGRASARDAQVKLDGLLDGAGPTSVNAALRADPTLGGVCSSSKIVSATSYGAHDFNGVILLGVHVHIETIVSN